MLQLELALAGSCPVKSMHILKRNQQQATIASFSFSKLFEGRLTDTTQQNIIHAVRIWKCRELLVFLKEERVESIHGLGLSPFFQCKKTAYIDFFGLPCLNHSFIYHLHSGTALGSL